MTNFKQEREAAAEAYLNLEIERGQLNMRHMADADGNFVAGVRWLLTSEAMKQVEQTLVQIGLLIDDAGKEDVVPMELFEIVSHVEQVLNLLREMRESVHEP